MCPIRRPPWLPLPESYSLNREALRLIDNEFRTVELLEQDFASPNHEADGAASAGIEQIQKQVLAAIEDPINYPALAHAMTEDDRIAIAVGSSISHGVGVVAGLVEYLIDQAIPGERIKIVLSNPTELARYETLNELLPPGAEIEVHDPSDNDKLCFGGMTKSERTLLINRTLFEADVLIPVLAVEPSDVLYAGPFDGLFPEFCDQPTIEHVSRVRSLTVARARGGNHVANRRREAEEIGWLIGVPFLVRVIPSHHPNPPTILAGEPLATEEASHKLCRQTWSAPPTDTVDLVIVTLGSNSQDQTWETLAKALRTADQLVNLDGIVVLWTELNQPIGEHLGKLMDREEQDQVAHDLSEASGAEAWAAWHLLQLMERGPLFFHSQIDDDLVEELGFAPINEVSDLMRLIERRGDCLLVEEAQHLFIDTDVEAQFEEEVEDEL